jgi:hypothetical protein
MEEEHAVKLRYQLGFPNGHAVGARGLSGGLVLF